MLLCTLLGCTTKKEVEVVEVPTLRASQLYVSQSVMDYMKQYQDAHKSLAEHYLGLAESVKKTQPEKASYYLKRAISLRPDLDSYVLLAKHLVSMKNYEEASKIYRLIADAHYIAEDKSAVFLFGEPNEEVRYEHLITDVLGEQVSIFWALQDHLAEKGGFDDPELLKRLLEDPRILEGRDSSLYKGIVNSSYLFGREGLETTPEFGNLLKLIHDSTSFYEISTASVGNFQYQYMDTDIEYDPAKDPTADIASYDGFLIEKIQNKDNYFIFNYNHISFIHDSLFAIEYSIDSSERACPKEMRHVYHRLAIYDRNGTVIDSKVVAWQCGEQLASMKFDNGKITIQESKRTWKRPYQKDDFDNYVTKTEALGAKSYVIRPNGKIEELSSL
jgi:hypothetical protein